MSGYMIFCIKSLQTNPFTSKLHLTLKLFIFFMIYLNILKILVLKVSIITNTKLIKVCLFVNLFCVYAYFIFNVF